MRIVNCWVYKTYYIWLFDDGHYQVEDVNSSFKTLKDAKKCIDHLVSNIKTKERRRSPA